MPLNKRSKFDDLETLPSIGETVENFSWLSEVLARDLRKDIVADESSLLRNADIDLAPVKMETNRGLLDSKIKEALPYWEELSERIPLTRQRPPELRQGRLAGSNEMCMDFDINPEQVPPDPPDLSDPSMDEVTVYRYYVQRIMCSVPRVEDLRRRLTEDSVPLRVREVKKLLDGKARVSPFGDLHLLKKTNFALKEDAEFAGDLLHPVATDFPSNNGGSIGGNRGGASFGDGEATAGSDAAAQTPGEKFWPSFSRPSRAVVTFVLYRSMGFKDERQKGSTDSAQRMPEMRMYEVEALEHHTLQQVMETMPPCLSDRIVEERIRGPDIEGGGGDASKSGAPRWDGMSLAGAFLFIRGVFYITRPRKWEDPSDIPLPPPPVFDLKSINAIGKVKRMPRRKRSPAKKNPPRENTESNTGMPNNSPPDPWMKRWIQIGHRSWKKGKGKLMVRAEEIKRSEDLGVAGTAAAKEAPGTDREAATSSTRSKPLAPSRRSQGGRGGGAMRGRGNRRGRGRGVAGGRKAKGKVTYDESDEESSEFSAVDDSEDERVSEEGESLSESDGAGEDKKERRGARVLASCSRTLSGRGRAISKYRRGDDEGDNSGRSETETQEEVSELCAKRTAKSKVRRAGKTACGSQTKSGTGKCKSRRKRKAWGPAEESDDELVGMSGSSMKPSPARITKGKETGNTVLSRSDGNHEGNDKGKGKGNRGGRTKVGEGSEAEEYLDQGPCHDTFEVDTRSRSSISSPTKQATKAAIEGPGKRKRDDGFDVCAGSSASEREEKARELLADRKGNGETVESNAKHVKPPHHCTGSRRSKRLKQPTGNGGEISASVACAREAPDCPTTAYATKERAVAEEGRHKSGRLAKEAGHSEKAINQHSCKSEVQPKNTTGSAKYGGKVKWASDVTVGDLRPRLGERYAFLHHCDCDHFFAVSDIRLEPLPPNLPPTSSATTSTTIDSASEDGSAMVIGAASGRVTGRGAEDGSLGDEAGAAQDMKRIGPKYPRLSYRVAPDARRCSICKTKTASKMSFGHPLSDTTPLLCCPECFEMLYYDQQGKALRGGLATDTPSFLATEGKTSVSPAGVAEDVNAGRARAADEDADGPDGWRVYNCYHER